jgi:hypothetical protein
MPTPDIDVVTRIQVEYLEMPDLKLTEHQGQRLWQLPVDVCEGALALLVERGFLARAKDGGFVRRGQIMSGADVLRGVF